MGINSLTLKPWQQVILDLIQRHDDLVGREDLQSLSDYDKNRFSRIQMGLPMGSGHTTFACWLAINYPSILLHTSTKNLLETLEIGATNIDDLLKSGSEPVSIFEFTHYVFSAGGRNVSDAAAFSRLKTKLHEKRLIVVDNATDLMLQFKPAFDTIFNIARGPIILLG